MTKSNDSMFIRFQLSDFWFSKRFKSLRVNSKAPKTVRRPAVFADAVTCPAFPVPRDFWFSWSIRCNLERLV